MHAGAWSYFGDPRSIARGSRIFTGCVGTNRGIVVEQYDRRTDESFHVHLHRNHEVDDHDNPSLALWRRRVYAFYSPHSGRVFPLNRHYTRDGVHWVKARTLVRGPARQRPYARYIGGADGSIHMVSSEAHPRSYRTSLYYVRYKAARFYRADGRLVGDMRDLPLRTSQLDRVYRFHPTKGRAWPHDIALAGGTRPVVAYTAREGGPGGIDTFYYARWDGAHWSSHRIVSAGRGALTFNSGGITFHHARPSWVVLSRTIGLWNEVELWRTPDGGRTWLAPVPVTTGSDAHNFRPAIPRNFNDTSSLVVLYVHRTADSFRSFRTVIQMHVAPLPPA